MGELRRGKGMRLWEIYEVKARKVGDSNGVYDSLLVLVWFGLGSGYLIHTLEILLSSISYWVP